MTPTDESAAHECPIDRLALIAESFARLTGKSLVAPAPDLRAALWHAPAVIVAHGIEPDPVFFYGNRAALDLFEMSFADFTRLPSRFSAEPMAREARAQLLARVSREGFIDDYRGVRVSASGKRFLIENAVVWNLTDSDGGLHGQAASFSRWRPLG
jgi:PAS domain-containing protein